MNNSVLSDGDLILRPYSDEDHNRTFDWLQDNETRRFTGTASAPTPETHANWLEIMRAKINTELYAIYYLEAHVGNAFLADIDRINRRAYPQLYLGPREIRGKGLGRRVIKLLLTRAFVDIGLHRCYGYPFEYNQPSIRMLQSVGYKIEGILKEHCWMNGAFHNVMVLGILNPND